MNQIKKQNKYQIVNERKKTYLHLKSNTIRLLVALLVVLTISSSVSAKQLEPSQPDFGPDIPLLSPGDDEGADDEGADDENADDEGAGDEGAGDEGADDEGAGDEGADDEGAGDENTGDESAGNEGAGDESADDEGAGDENAGDEAAGDEGAGEEAANAKVTVDESAAKPDFGPNVLIFDPSMPTSDIQAAVDAIAAQQVDDEMGTGRYALLFEPGTYGSAEEPLIIQVGYYTEVAGLGALPTDVVINGNINVFNRCRPSHSDPSIIVCFALDNFWRSLSNLSINVVDPPNDGCYTGNFWAASQAAPMRRVNISGGTLTLMDYCTGPSFASGGYIADSQIAGTVINGSQQQYLVRNSSVGGWSNGVWNQVFAGVEGAPDECFPATSDCGPYTTLDRNPITREKPFVYIDSQGEYQVFVPAARRDTRGISWDDGQGAGKSIPLSDFYIAQPGDSGNDINKKLDEGKNLIFTPGIYELKKEIKVKRAGTVVLGLGLPTLVPTNGKAAMEVFDVEGVILAGFMIDAGPKNSKVLLEIGSNSAKKTSEENPTTLNDIFFRHGGARLGKATTALIINSDNVLLDHLWVWRADHGIEGTFGWDLNTGDTGVIVNGDNVKAYGLFVEHYQKYEVIWNGNDGRIVLFQNEKPYDPPSQEAWKAAPDVDGWAALKVADDVTRFNGYGMGSYSFFNQGANVFLENAFEVPSTLPVGSLQNMLTVFLDPVNGDGGIRHVINGVGGSSTIDNPATPVTVVSYPTEPPITELTVTTFDDSGEGSLRDALALIADGGTITLDSSLAGQTISLTTGPLVPANSVTIDASAAPGLTLNGGGGDRVLIVNAGLTVNVSHLTVTNGYGYQLAGGILNNGNLTLDHVMVTGNTASTDAGDFWQGGGGIYVGEGATLSLIESTVSGNETQGGIDGGGVYAFFNTTVTIDRSTISGNTASNVGGGMRTLGNTTIVNSTLSGNVSTAWHGGAIFHTDGQMSIINSTITDNTAPVDTAAGIVSADFGGASPVITLVNTIVANNITGTSCAVVNFGGGAANVVSSGHNIDSDATCNLTAADDQPNTDPLLGPLADNGGPTLTHVPGAGSPAIDTADAGACPATDQRGVARPQGAGCDVGAVEQQ